MNHETHEKHEKILFKEESFAIQGAVFEVSREIGCGFLEAVYQECLQREFELRNIPFQSQVELPIKYKGRYISQRYIPDFICFQAIIVELKSVKEVVDEHRAQVFNYLKASNFRLGLLVNFGHYPKASVERIII